MLAQRADTCVVVALLEQLGTDTGAPRNEFPSPCLHACGEVFNCKVKSPPMNLMKGPPWDGEVVVLAPPLSDCWSKDGSIEVVCMESGLFAAVES